MATKWQRIEIELPEKLPPRQRDRLADLIIDHIIRRTEKGIDKDGSRFPGYSKGYVESLDFKIAGKSKSKIDLTLSGDMLASMELLKDTERKLTIGFERGSEENARADGNIRGTYGQSSENRKKARDFLGLEPGALDKLVKRVKREASGG